jgi:hypothetical protein
MKDQADRQAVDIFETNKRGRGRPVTGQAMTNAERQKSYRLRVKRGQVVQLPTVTEMLNENCNVTENSNGTKIALTQYQADVKNLEFARNEIDRLNNELEQLKFFLDCHARSDMKNRKLLEEALEENRRLDMQIYKLKQKNRNVTKKQGSDTDK